jgi:hypothetical protein
MISRLAIHPDLDECLLEERLLLYAGPALYASQFIPSAGLTPSFVVSGFQQSNSSPGSSGSTNPGPQYYIPQIGVNSVSNGGVRLGGTFSIYNPPSVLPAAPSVTVGSIPGSGASAGGISNTSAYGGSISSGYNTALNSANNYGMGTTPVGSITAHVSGTTDQLAVAQAANASTNSPVATGGEDDTNASPATPLNAAQGPFSTSTQDRLLGRGLGSSNGLLIGPGMSPPPSSSGRP